ncbi:hypothetical protein [Caballeronia sp. BCC1704]|uniref:hypothetical protein n=1 Tax=Caballeronia sp. BCC1704 TaxID=2676300 RepID=UPI001588DD4F|nr:hypothetical protein [Caballeronia sp. BCC1704]
MRLRSTRASGLRWIPYDSVTQGEQLEFYRRNWYYVGGILFVLLAYLMGFWGADHLAPVQIILVYSFMAMLAHQFEEYAAPGGFPGIGNIAMFGERRTPIATGRGLRGISSSKYRARHSDGRKKHPRAAQRLKFIGDLAVSHEARWQPHSDLIDLVMLNNY